MSFQLGDHPGGDQEPEQICGHLLDLPLAESIGPREQGQNGLEVRAKAPAEDTRGQNTAGLFAAARTDQAMEPILVDDRFDPGKFGHLVDQRLGVITGELMTATATTTRLAVDRLADLLGWDQGTVGLAMPRLPATFLLTGWRGRLSLQSNWIGRGGLGGIGGVELETILKVLDPRFELIDPLFVVSDERKDRRLDLWRSRLP